MMMFAFALVGISIVLSLYRLFRGPESVDRMVSLDTINMIVIGLISMLTIYYGNPLFIDIAIAYSILAFLETTVFGRYVEGKL
ncbi:MAG TPA: cation:proton antiporter [Peptococcaceae bacterium]|nr:cation:proton antiporter [Peptococcaceae bacterium]